MTRAQELLAQLPTETEIAAQGSKNPGLIRDAKALRKARVDAAQADRAAQTEKLHQQHGTGRVWVSPTTTT